MTNMLLTAWQTRVPRRKVVLKELSFKGNISIDGLHARFHIAHHYYHHYIL